MLEGKFPSDYQIACNTVYNHEALEAAQKGEIKKVNYFINKKINFSTKDIDGNSALHLAIKNNQTEIVKILSEYKPHLLNEKNKYDMTPAFLSLKEKNWQLLKFCINSSPQSVEIKDRYEKNLVLNLTESISRLSSDEDLEKISVLKLIAEVAPESFFITNNMDKSAILSLIKQDNVEVLKVLARHSLKHLMEIDKYGNNLAHVAASFRQWEVLSFLKSVAPELFNQKNTDFVTPTDIEQIKKMTNPWDEEIDYH